MPSLIGLIKKTYKMVSPLERQVVMKNVAALSVLQAITYVLPILILPYLFRVIGPEKFGLIAFAQAFVQYFIILTDYGFNISATREISLARHHHAKVCNAFSAVMTIKIGLAILSLFGLSLIVYFVPKFHNDWVVYIFSFGSVIGSTLFPVWFFQGTEKMKHIAELNIVGGIVYAVCILLLVRRPEDYLKVPLVNSSISLITGLAAQYMIFRKFKITFQFQQGHHLRQQLKAGWDIFISIAAINAYTSTRVFVIGLFTNNALTGFYSIAERIANACQTFPLWSFSQAIFPRLSAIFHKNKTKAFRIMQRIRNITVIISLICLPLIFSFAHIIVRIICGADYPAVVISLRILLVAVFFVSANAFPVQFLLVCGKTQIYSRIHVMMAMVGLPLIVLLTYSFSYAGAATATVIIEGGIFLITYFTVKWLRF